MSHSPHGPSDREVPTVANTGAVAAVGLDLQEGTVVPRKQVVSWALWDWATQPFNSVILTFVFTALYLTTDTFLDPTLAALPDGDPAKERGLADLAGGLGLATTLAGVAIALVAPVLGQRADGSGRRKLWLLIYTAALTVCTGLLFFVEGTPSFFLLGISLIAIGSVFSELAGVNYNAMLVQVSTPKTVGRVSGLGWGLGYVGGSLALVAVVVANSSDWFGLPLENGLPFRVVALGCALWTIVFVIPFILNVPELPADPTRERPGFFASYGLLFRHVAALYRDARATFWFLLASAVYRDGLAGVFTFGAIIASVAFGFSSNEVIVFGIAANLVAGISTIIAGRFDDRFGSRAVILTALVGLVVCGLGVFFFADLGSIVFWIGGLLLCCFVGPAQAASRTMLARVTPVGREGEVFGLYATTGRAVSFLSGAAWSAFVLGFGSTIFGILGIILVIAAGLVLMLLVKMPKHIVAR
jgi:UMF1 family MFS transporter